MKNLLFISIAVSVVLAFAFGINYLFALIGNPQSVWLMQLLGVM
jgi:hypothetical protein